MELGGIGTSTAGLQAGGSAAALAENFDDFLTLLTAQMQYQDPLSPLEANEFTSQLVQFSAVEQAINTNGNLAKLIDLQRAGQIATAVDFIGTKIEAFGNTNVLADGSATFSYGLGENANTTQISIFNEVGQVVFSTTGETAAGHHTYSWDGNDNNGIAQPDGKYSIVVTSLNENGEPIGVETGVIGTVTGFETTADGSVLLSLNGIGVPIGDIVSVSPDTSE
ncbi:MAG: flagellar hook assembly protein FlgD [Alphaproteobacteria bacterium]|nr:flagellar hook assembly protein FlgD [Alphaproteobacteria bacterium]